MIQKCRKTLLSYILPKRIKIYARFWLNFCFLVLLLLLLCSLLYVLICAKLNFYITSHKLFIF
nr:MAG TPA: hypothetical protein [Caudoviricetes sp.]